MAELKSEFLCDIIGDLEDPIPVGNTCHGARMIYKIKGGSVTGPKVKGEVLPMGADWLLIRPDGVAELDVRASMRTDDGQVIYTCYKGILNIPLEVMKRFQSGGAVEPSEYYFRTTPAFETGSEKYKWLSNIVAVGVGELGKNQVRYKVYQIL